MENYGPRAPTDDPTKNEDDKARRILTDTCRKTDDGTYETGFLWTSTEELPSNRIFAENHLRSVQSKLMERYDLAQLYRKEIQKDLDKGYIEDLNRKQEEDNTKFFLPHYGIVSPAKPGNIRRITNATAVFNGTCLNDHLLPGPDLQSDLVGIMLRSREKPMLITANIEGFLNQVVVRKKNQCSCDFCGTKTSTNHRRNSSTKDTYLVREIQPLLESTLHSKHPETTLRTIRMFSEM